MRELLGDPPSEVGNPRVAAHPSRGFMPCINPGAIHRTKSFLVANSILVVIWFAYHVPVIFVPGVYSNPGIPTWAILLLFAIAITGFSFFVGALWEKHHDVWGATFAHGVWNHLVQGAWPLMFIAASPWVMGEFGVVAGIVTVVIALARVPRIARRHRARLPPSGRPLWAYREPPMNCRERCQLD